jgi:hypothetical protein
VCRSAFGLRKYVVEPDAKAGTSAAPGTVRAEQGRSTIAKISERSRKVAELRSNAAGRSTGKLLAVTSNAVEQLRILPEARA